MEGIHNNNKFYLSIQSESRTLHQHEEQSKYSYLIHPLGLPDDHARAKGIFVIQHPSDKFKYDFNIHIGLILILLPISLFS